MSNHIRISVAHQNEEHHFVFDPFFKRMLPILVVVLLFSIIATVGYLKYKSIGLEEAAQSLRQRSDELTEELLLLSEKRLQLEQIISNSEQTYSQIIQEKNDELDVLNRRVSGVEELLGLDDENGTVPLSERIDAAAVNSAVRSTMLQFLPNGNPVKSFRSSSGYGTRVHPVTGKLAFHKGLDLAMPTGTPVYSTADGVVEEKFVSQTKGYGNMLKIRHAFGFMTLYAHLDRFNVQPGQFVKKGDLIAWSGNTGLSTGPHLHYEVRFLGHVLRPHRFMEWSATNFEEIFSKENKIKWGELIAVLENTAAINVKLTSQTTTSPKSDSRLAKSY
ncbi:MAG: M23 family metallopeptidase [Vibrionaceae bacterium]